MPRTASLELEFAAADADLVLAALADLLVPTARYAVPAVELRGLVAALSRTPGAVECVTLEFDPDDLLAAFAADNPELAPRTAGRVAVGCLWTSVQVVGDRLGLAMTSATASIAELLRASPSVRRAFQALPAAAPVRMMLVDDDGERRDFG